MITSASRRSRRHPWVAQPSPAAAPAPAEAAGYEHEREWSASPRPRMGLHLRGWERWAMRHPVAFVYLFLAGFSLGAVSLAHLLLRLIGR